jgi:hypothetical protein
MLFTAIDVLNYHLTIHSTRGVVPSPNVYRAALSTFLISTMGITLSHTLFATTFLVSTIIGFIPFVFTLGTFITVFRPNMGTFAAALHTITDFLSNTKQGL